MDKNGVVLKRNDNEWDFFSEPAIVYNLTSISSLAKDKLDRILPVIKKMILGSSFIFSWKAISSIQIILEIHMLLVLSSVTALMTHKEIVADKVQIYKFVLKFLLLNIITLPLWVATYLLVIKPSNQVYSALFNMSYFILDRESLYNRHVSYSLNKDFSIKITPKQRRLKPEKSMKPIGLLSARAESYRLVPPKWAINALVTDSLIDYSVNICLFFEERMHSYQNLLEKEDLAVINQFWAYNKREIQKNITHLCKQYLVPSIIAIGSYFFHLRNDIDKTFPVYLTAMVLVVISFIWVLLIRKENELISNMDDYINEWNKTELIKKGKFVYRYHSLLSVFCLTPKGKMADDAEIKTFINQTFQYQPTSANLNDDNHNE